MQITFEKCTTNFYFENGKVSIKTATSTLQPLLDWDLTACLHIFMQPRF